MARSVSTLQTLNPPREGPSRGRGGLSNASGRFEPLTRHLFDDGWTPDEPPPLRTEVTTETAKRIITSNDSPDIPFDQSINPYRGCEHGCVYCYARPTHAYMGLSPGRDFETKLFAKPNAAELLRKELAAPSYVPSAIALGTNTDPYQPIEKRLKITRSIIEVLAEHRHPFSIVTKSHLVTRDIDLLASLARSNLVKVFLSVTSLNPRLARAMEPRAATPALRLAAIRQLAEAGIPTGVMVAPVIPALNDAEIEAILEAAKDAGAGQAGYVMLRLPLEIKHLFREWLDEVAPYRADHVMRLVRDVRGGRDYDPTFGRRMRGTGPYAKMIAVRFKQATARLGLNRGTAHLDVGQFRRPPRAGDQLALL